MPKKTEKKRKEKNGTIWLNLVIQNRCWAGIKASQGIGLTSENDSTTSK